MAAVFSAQFIGVEAPMRGHERTAVARFIRREAYLTRRAKYQLAPASIPTTTLILLLRQTITDRNNTIV